MSTIGDDLEFEDHKDISQFFSTKDFANINPKAGNNGQLMGNSKAGRYNTFDNKSKHSSRNSRQLDHNNSNPYEIFNRKLKDIKKGQSKEKILAKNKLRRMTPCEKIQALRQQKILNKYYKTTQD